MSERISSASRTYPSMSLLERFGLKRREARGTGEGQKSKQRERREGKMEREKGKDREKR